MTNAAQKTPISLLQELCAQQGMTPEYKLMSVEGAVHAPTFMYRVQVNDVVATATGQSKKKAKHAAAKAILERLLGAEGQFKEGFISDGVTVNADTLNEIISEPAAVPVVDENAGGNPVGQLQEYCMKHRLQPPFYETEKATGLPHEKVFSIMCVVNKNSATHTSTGEGKSKRLAKRQAAANMLKILESLGDDDDDDVSKESEVGDVTNKTSNADESEPTLADKINEIISELKLDDESE